MDVGRHDLRDQPALEQAFGNVADRAALDGERDREDYPIFTSGSGGQDGSVGIAQLHGSSPQEADVPHKDKALAGGRRGQGRDAVHRPAHPCSNVRAQQLLSAAAR
ncbi:MAG: hypothetical protein EOO80_10110 [Oxalobacteraceae bacterium]|nr:MAG: hypothetical protein EOO80_10110 [Oxalobacteraceae bacterium]